MLLRLLAVSILLACVSGCVTGYTLVETGPTTIGPLAVNATPGYNLAPEVYGSGRRKGTQAWTQDGLLLDRLVFIPGVPDGETIVMPLTKDAALPVFRKDMLPNEIEELVESTIVKDFGEGNAAVTTSNLRPHRFGEHAGFLFDISAIVTESPRYDGVVGAFVADEQLYLMWYFGAQPYYHDKHRADAEAIIKGARLTTVAAN